MSKKLRSNPIYIAPAIFGWIDDEGGTHVLDEIGNSELNPNNIDDKITIYERQVNRWFLNEATRLVDQEGCGFIVLMICMSYIEGIEQYIRGESSINSSRVFFVNSMNRIFGEELPYVNYTELYSEVRCGLFHNGMTRGKIIIRNNYPNAIAFIDDFNIHINPKLMLEIIRDDFDWYIEQIKEQGNLRLNFDSMFSNLW